jgi:hypothetical protein
MDNNLGLFWKVTIFPVIMVVRFGFSHEKMIDNNLTKCCMLLEMSKINYDYLLIEILFLPPN